MRAGRRRPHDRCWGVGLSAGPLLLALTLTSCGDKSDEPPAIPTLAPATPTAAQRSPSPAPSPSPTPTPNPDAERTAVIDAATAATGARYVSPLTLPACLQDNPERKPCIELKTAPDQLARGIARFALGAPEGGGATFLMGRMRDGRWGYWRGTQQQFYVLEALPGQLLACNKEGPAEIRAEPSTSAAIIATPPDLSPLAATDLLLTIAGQYGVQGQRGEAWYHLTSPAAGWIDATETTDARLGDCLLHDQVEQVDHG